MTRQNLKVLFVCTEAAPFSSIGGLAQVSYFLPRTLKKIGVDIALFTPKYGTIDEKKYGIVPLIKNIRVPTSETKGTTELICNIKIRKATKREPTVYFLENMEYFEKRANVYGYNDDHIRFALLSRAVLEFIRTTGYKPNIIHLNDWHTGLVANYLQTIYAPKDPLFRSISTVFTIHNMRNQGMFDFRFASPMDFDDGKSSVLPLFHPDMRKQNSLKRGIMYSDLVNTVSETYAREIMTTQYGEGLGDLIKELRTKVFGVLNGLDYTDFDPSTDPVLKENYSWRTYDKRRVNKVELQKEFRLEINARIPILAYSGRLDDQKGLDLLVTIIPQLLNEFDIQFIIMGTGDPKYREFFSKLEKEYPGKVGTHLMRNFILPRKIFAGCDMLLLPSKFEPGGIVVIEGMRYGAVPVVRETGGLADIVRDFDPESTDGNGFTFKQYNELSLFGAVVRAVQVYRNTKLWEELVKRILKADFSWEQVAVKYKDLYERAIEFRRDRQSPVFSVRRVET